MTAKKDSSNSFKYGAFQFRQRGKKGPQLVVFLAPVGEILLWAKVMELGPDTSGPQREKREAKVEAIQKFLHADVRNTIPTAVVVAFAKNSASFTQALGGEARGRLHVVSGIAGHIVDGQHRLHGINEYDPKTSVPVIGLLDVDEVEEAFQFLVINNKATRVPATHTKALLARMQGTELAQRLRAARVAFDAEGIKDVDLVNSDDESPFFQSVDWPTTPERKRLVQATAIEFALGYLANLGVPELEDRDVRRSVFLTMWRVIKTMWAPLWKRDSRLISKVGIVCLTRVIADLIVSWADSDELEIDVSDLAQIEVYTTRITKRMNADFWRAPWAEKAPGGFDTAQGRDRVSAALKQLYRNGKAEVEWHSEIDIIDSAGMESPDGDTPSIVASSRRKAAKKKLKLGARKR